MARKHDVHVMPAATRGGWIVEHGRHRLSRHRTQRYAVKAGRLVARRAKVDLVTHGRDGRIRSKDSYGNETAAPDAHS
jgi:hypothetical protein